MAKFLETKIFTKYKVANSHCVWVFNNSFVEKFPQKHWDFIIQGIKHVKTNDKLQCFCHYWKHPS